ncbi:CoA ester lyase [Dactylosporangium sp. NPDC000244]|uniref:HpcH/HpaI aldolase/citrate lyase family protein n=1 Tax=Dactylosporangium sp. NPDC000244 TaxID=3154365 RepID=UPI003324A854
MIRSMLVVPPLTPGMLDKALTTDADALMVELEDGIHRSRKDEARQAVAEFIARGEFADKVILVRVNDVLTPAGQEDLRRLAALRAPAVILPKVRSKLDVERADEIMKRAETDASMPVGGTRIWVMIETTDAVLNLEEIAAAPRVAGFTFGAGDMSAELRVRRIGVGADRPIWSFPLELIYAKQRAVAVARSRGLTVLDTGFSSFRDLEGTGRAALISAQMGFDGTGCFSPKQIAPIHSEFTPTNQEYDWACRAVAALAEADRRGETVVVLDGEMVEGPLVRSAQAMIHRYETYAARDLARQAARAVAAA